ncbi:MAG: hypothetical protein QOJ99_628 [Bryobacterales bacterium]|jgi:uncharacterized damage-inducible protein DinB|nr:hypothetical protein [Bryobacterales bacterium]
MNKLLIPLLLSGLTLLAQTDRVRVDPIEGLWEGYDAEWGHVSRQLIALAEATPAEKFAWRPAPGVRSTGEVYMHIALANFSLLSVTGPALPQDLKSGSNPEKNVTAKADIISWLRRSQEAVKTAHAGLTSSALQRRVKISGKDVSVDGMYLRIIVHANEHMGQLIAYARMSRITPPWSETTAK